MLAAIGWPLSELWNPCIAGNLDLPAMTTPNDLAPGVLNGNISDVNPLFFIGALVFGSIIEIHTLRRKVDPKFIGDLGFDPLKAYPEDPKLQRQIQETELLNGRIAMLSITFFSLYEFVSHIGIIDK